MSIEDKNLTAPVPPVAPNRPARRRIGEILQESGLINEQDLTSALAESRQSGQFIGLVLVKMGKITTEQLGQALAVQYGLKYVNISKIPINPELMELLPNEFILEKQVVPIAKERGRLVVAMVNPANREIIDEITFITGMRPLVTVTTSIDFLEFCNKNLAESSTTSIKEEISSFSGQLREQNKELENIQQQRDAELTDNSNPLIKLVNSIIEEGIERNASDIHIEPRLKKYLVRFRVDGILRTILDVPQNMEASFVTRIKVMARMDIAEHRRPQDGRITIKYKNAEYNLRVNTLPVSDNREKIVIRILRPSKNISDFKALGFDEDDISKLEYLYKSPYGIILVCGPTGSGKTTTLYTVLQRINDDIRNICTVEDPVELQIEGLNQSQVNPKADYTFASSMRALLRQDPDVIMVGEIRDYETLEAAVHAALTGHLVFSTIHSNTTAATITRMIEMGAASNLIGSALVGILAQRLVRNICPYCKVAYEATEVEKAMLLNSTEAKRLDKLILYKGKGCELCMNSGYAGRSGVYEILIVDREIRQLINDSHSDLDIEDAAVAAGMKSLGMNGRTKVLNGVTTLEEVIRVLGVNLGGQ
jgi:type IV pilus assembly protein PilB